jgi:trehalose/maltose transport system permease protein
MSSKVNAKYGISKLAKREERLAYKLVLPALIVLALVAFYPLSQVFYASFTDRTFASARETNFIGFENYKRLFGITIKELPPIIDEETGLQQIDEFTGELEFVAPFRILPRNPRYNELSRFNFFGKKYVIGARDPDFLRSIGNTLTFTFFSVILETILGMIIALTINSKIKGKGPMRAVMLVPWAVITVVSARMWQWMFFPTRAGFFNAFFDRIGLTDGSTGFLTDVALQMPAIIAVDVWKTTPFMALLILAGLQTIPSEIYEAARVDGASKPRQFFSMTLPLLKPTLAVALIFRTLDALRAFDVFHVLLGGRRYSMASYSYFELINNRNMGYSSAIGVVIFFIIFIFAFLYIRFMGVDKDE